MIQNPRSQQDRPLSDPSPATASPQEILRHPALTRKEKNRAAALKAVRRRRNRGRRRRRHAGTGKRLHAGHPPRAGRTGGTRVRRAGGPHQAAWAFLTHEPGIGLGGRPASNLPAEIWAVCAITQPTSVAPGDSVRTPAAPGLRRSGVLYFQPGVSGLPAPGCAPQLPLV